MGSVIFGGPKESDENEEVGAGEGDEKMKLDENDDVQSISSLLDEAQTAAARTTKILPAKGWMKGQVVKSIKAHRKTMKDAKEAKTAKAKAETYATKAKANAAKVMKGAKMVMKAAMKNKKKTVKVMKGAKMVMKGSKAKEAKGERKACQDGHDLSNPILMTRMTQAKTGRVRTYIQGKTKLRPRWFLICEVSLAQHPSHYQIMQEVAFNWCSNIINS